MIMFLTLFVFFVLFSSVGTAALVLFLKDPQKPPEPIALLEDFTFASVAAHVPVQRFEKCAHGCCVFEL